MIWEPNLRLKDPKNWVIRRSEYEELLKELVAIGFRPLIFKEFRRYFVQIPFPIWLRMAIWASNWLSNLIHQSHLDIYNTVVTFSLVFSLCRDVFFFSDLGWEKGKKMCGPRAVASNLFMFESDNPGKMPRRHGMFFCTLIAGANSGAKLQTVEVFSGWD